MWSWRELRCKQLVLLGVLLGVGLFPPASAAFPDRSIKFIVPFAAGGPTDALARYLAEGVRVRLGQPVIIENRAGAGANVGAEYVANAIPDGYTLAFRYVGTAGDQRKPVPEARL
ncbi:tripartite-type tricarboxylate transporter receptor subunit TctC [Bradyrhizobium sp. i1.4.4]